MDVVANILCIVTAAIGPVSGGGPPFCLVSQAPTLTENAISYFLYELVGLTRCHYL